MLKSSLFSIEIVPTKTGCPVLFFLIISLTTALNFAVSFLYTKSDNGMIGAVLIEDCVAFNNGVDSNGKGLESSDGNGFKLGGESISVPHVVKNCVAFNNLSHGFTDNSNPGTIWMENCTSFNNSIRDAESNNIDMCRDKEITRGNYFKNVLSYWIRRKPCEKSHGFMSYVFLFKEKLCYF